MKTPRHTEPPARDDDGRLLSSPAVCPACRCRPVRVVSYTNASGEKAYRASTSCRECQEAAFGGGSAPAAPAVVEVMRKAGLPVAELDPHERARLSLSRSHRIGCAS